MVFDKDESGTQPAVDMGMKEAKTKVTNGSDSSFSRVGIRPELRCQPDDVVNIDPLFAEYPSIFSEYSNVCICNEYRSNGRNVDVCFPFLALETPNILVELFGLSTSISNLPA